MGGKSTIAGTSTHQGPALSGPREIMLMLEQRDRVLDLREQRLKSENGRLFKLKGDIQALLNRLKKGMRVADEKSMERESRRLATEARLKRLEERAKAENKKLTTAHKKRDDAKEQKQTARLKKIAKMYEAMPPEEAASRIEQLPQGTAIKVLLLIKSRAAGNILAEVSPRKAAKLTERYLSGK